LVIGQGLYIVLATAFSPVFNMFSVAERFVAYNLWTLAERACQLTAALWLHHVTGVSSPPAGVFAYGYLVAGLQGAVFVVPVAWLMLSDPRLRPRPSKVGKSEIRELSRTLGWYFAVELGSSLHERVGALIMNAYFALLGSIVFGLALQFTSYVRLATQGVTFGLDAVSARISTEKNKSLSVLLTHSTRLHGLVAFPAGLVMAALAHPLIQLWVGGKPDITPEIIDRTALTVQIMSVALTSRAISDGWMMILYGAGFLRVYAPLVLVGAMFNPAITLGTLWSIPQGQIVQNVGFLCQPDRF
jgi:O-antigen/teichoic acid export membrane protein